MEHHLYSIALSWVINIGFGMLAMLVALLMLRLIDRFLFREIDLIQEVRQGNVAAAICFAAILGFAAYIIGSAVH